jgi:hypothetical protein
MSLTKATGMLIILLAALLLIVGIVNMGPSWSSAPEVLNKSDVYGLNMDDTSVRFQLGLQLTLQVLIALGIGIAGWWLTTQEVRQVGYMVGLVVVLIFLFATRSSPLVSVDLARKSPVTLFYGAMVEVPTAADTTSGWITLPLDPQHYRVAVTALYSDPAQMGHKEVVLSFPDMQTMQQFVMTKGGKAKVTGYMTGTRVIAHGKDFFTVPFVRVQSVK